MSSLKDHPDAGSARDALDGLYRRYARWLARALRLRFGGSFIVEEDVVQEAYVRIAPYAGQGQVRHPQAMLLKVATNLVRDELRRGRGVGGGAHVLVAEWDETVETAVPAEQEAIVAVRQAVLALPPNLRDVFVLSRFAGLSNQKIAEQCGLSVKTVEERMTKALSLLRAQLLD